MDSENNKKLEQYKNSSKHESEGTVERPEMRTHADFEVMVMKGSEDALRNIGGGYLRSEELRSYVDDFFSQHLGASDEQVNTVKNKLRKHLKKFPPLLKEKKSLEKQERSDEQKKRIDEIEEELDRVREHILAMLADAIKKVTREPEANAVPQQSPEEQGSASDTDAAIKEAFAQKQASASEQAENVEIDFPYNPQDVELDTLRTMLESPDGIEHLIDMVESYSDEIRKKYERKGLNQRRIVELEQKGGPLTGIRWNYYTRERDNLLKELRARRESGTVVLSDVVMQSKHGQWKRFFEHADTVYQMIEAYEGEAQKVSKNEEVESETEAQSTNEKASSEEATDEAEKADTTEAGETKSPDETEIQADEVAEQSDANESDKKDASSSGGESPSKGEKESGPDDEYQKKIEDALEQVEQEVVDTVSNPEALPAMDEYQEFQRLLEEVRTLLNEKNEEDVPYAMYGSMPGVRYSTSDREAITEKLTQIDDLKQQIYDDFGVHSKEGSERSGGEKETLKEDLKEAREELHAVRKEYDDALRQEYQRQHGKGVRGAMKRAATNVLSLFGVAADDPAATAPELQELEERYAAARKKHAQALAPMLAHRKANRKTVETEFDFEDDNIRRAAAYKYQINVDRRREKIRNEIFRPSESVTRVHAMFRRNKNAVRIAGVVGVAAIAGLTAGASLSEVARRRLVGATVGVAAGVGTAKLIHSYFFKEGIAQKEQAVEHTKEDIVSGFDIENIGSEEDAKQRSQLREQREAAEQSKRKAKTWSTVGGAAAGIGVGAAASDMLETLSATDSAETSATEKAAGVDVPSEETTPAAPEESTVHTSPESEAQPAEPREPEPMVDDHRSAGTNSWGGLTNEDKLVQPHGETTAVESPTSSEAPTSDPSATESTEPTDEGPIQAETATDAAAAEEAPVAAAAVEAPTDADIYEVQKGDNLWNILEGDVEGREMSDVLQRIPEAQRNGALEALFDRVDSDESLREAIGMRSNSADTIYYDLDGKGNGEQLNIDVLEKALEEVATEKGYIDTETPSVPVTTEDASSVKPENETPDTSNYERSGPDDGLRGAEDTSEYDRSESGEDIHENDTSADESTAIENTTEQTEQTPTTESPQPVQERIPNDRLIEVKDAYIKDHLKEEGGFLGAFLSSDTPSAYEVLQDRRMEDIAEMDSVPEGMTESQWQKLVEMLKEASETTVPDRPDETLSQYMDRFAYDHEVARLQNAANDSTAASATRKAA